MIFNCRGARVVSPPDDRSRLLIGKGSPMGPWDKRL